jgi:opacity protein-like surface antigen
LTANLNSSRVGTYCQYSLGVAGQIVNTGWLGYARVDFREGPKIEGVSVNGGIRYQFNPEAPVQTAGIFKAPVHVPKASVAAAPYSWTGFYIGGFLGTAWGETEWENIDNAGLNTFPRPQGLLAGGQIGYNYQSGPWVFGLEGDIGWTNAAGSSPFPFGKFAFFVTANTSMDWLATATARVGYAWNRALFYVKGGGAWVRNKYSLTDNTGGAIEALETGSDTRTGWTVGAGLEFGLAPNWSAKVEYDYLDFGTRSITVTDDFVDTANIREKIHEVKIGVSYRFAGLDAVAVAAPAVAFPTKAPAFPTKAPFVAPTPAVFNWGGCYVGVAGGGAWGRSHHDTNGTLLTEAGILSPVPIAITGDFDVSGGIFGGTTGCNLLQFGNWVFGVESDYSWTSKRGSTLDLASFTAATGISENSETRERWLSTDRVRVGYAWNNWLVYATAGAAVGDVRIQACDVTVSAVGCLSESHTRAGWTVGGGVEWAFAPNWSAKLEYLYADFGRTDYFNPTPVPLQQPCVNPACPLVVGVGGIAGRVGGVFLDDSIVRLGVNWRFNLDFGKAPTPVVAKY